jgi:hypothetical protein
VKSSGDTVENPPTKWRAGIIRDSALCMKEYINDPALPQYTAQGVLRCPTVRVEYEQAIAIGGIGECLAATKGKTWGDGPQVLPLEQGYAEPTIMRSFAPRLLIAGPCAMPTPHILDVVDDLMKNQLLVVPPTSQWDVFACWFHGRVIAQETPYDDPGHANAIRPKLLRCGARVAHRSRQIGHDR